MGNALDKLAKTATPKKSSSPKIAAKVNETIRGKVDLVIHHKAQLAQLEAECADAEGAIVDHVRPQQDEAGFKGGYCKSYTVAGNTGELTYTTTDRWTLPQDEASQNQIRDILGSKYDQVVKKSRTITFNEVDDATIDKVVEALSNAGLDVASLLSVVDKFVATKDLDSRLYGIVTLEQLAALRNLLKQYKPGLK